MEYRKTFFMGSGDFSSMVLDKIHGFFNNLSLVTLDNDNLSSIKIAKKNNIKIFRVKNKIDFEKLLEKETPSIKIVCDFGIIITKEALKNNDPIINIHPSILPKYRGCSPIISAIINNDEYTGVSLMKMNKGIDQGPVYKIKKIKLDKKEDIYSLNEKLSSVASELIINNIEDILSGKIKPKKQDEKESICTNLISKEQGKLNLSENADIIERKIRAYKKWPGVFTYIKANGKKINIKITEADVIYKKGREKIHIDKNCFDLKTAKGYLSIKKIQPEGKKEMDIKNFLCGYKNINLTN